MPIESPYPPASHRLGRLVAPAAIVLTAVFLAFGMTATAYAEPPGSPPGRDAPSCHGSADEECKNDPQPDKGEDCEKSDDHACLPANPASPPETNNPPSGDPP